MTQIQHPMETYTLQPDYVALKHLCEQTITTYLQTNKQGLAPDTTIHVTDLEIRNCTIADCFHILYEDSQRERSDALQYEEQQLLNLKRQLADCHVSNNVSEYLDQIKLTEARLSALQGMQPVQLQSHENCPETHTEVGLHVVCNYLVYFLTALTTQERIDIFILSPDGQMIIGKMNDCILPGKVS